MWIGTRIGGAYIAMPFIAWVIVGPLILGAMLVYYVVYGAVLGVVWLYERHGNGDPNSTA